MPRSTGPNDNFSPFNQASRVPERSPRRLSADEDRAVVRAVLDVQQPAERVRKLRAIAPSLSNKLKSLPVVLPAGTLAEREATGGISCRDPRQDSEGRSYAICIQTALIVDHEFSYIKERPRLGQAYTRRTPAAFLGAPGRPWGHSSDLWRSRRNSGP